MRQHLYITLSGEGETGTWGALASPLSRDQLKDNLECAGERWARVWSSIYEGRDGLIYCEHPDEEPRNIPDHIMPDIIRALAAVHGGQHRLAHELGVSIASVNNWVNSRSKPSGLALARICQATPSNSR